MVRSRLLRSFRELIRVPRFENRVPRIRENYNRVPRIRENRVPRIWDFGSLQVHTRYLTFSLKQNWVGHKVICCRKPAFNGSVYFLYLTKFSDIQLQAVNIPEKQITQSYSGTEKEPEIKRTLLAVQKKKSTKLYTWNWYVANPIR